MRMVRCPLGLLIVATVFALVAGVDSAEAQVSAADGQPFLGKWTLTLQPPAGGPGGGGGARPGGGPGGPGGPGGGRMGGPMVLDIVESNGQLKATLTGGMGSRGQAREITNLRKSGDNLVLGYTIPFGGQEGAATITLSPAADRMNAALDLGGMMTLSGTAAKE